eukprot:6376458-Amphidinium_carterae.1
MLYQEGLYARTYCTSIHKQRLLWQKNRVQTEEPKGDLGRIVCVLKVLLLLPLNIMCCWQWHVQQDSKVILAGGRDQLVVRFAHALRLILIGWCKL